MNNELLLFLELLQWKDTAVRKKPSLWQDFKDEFGWRGHVWRHFAIKIEVFFIKLFNR